MTAQQLSPVAVPTCHSPHSLSVSLGPGMSPSSIFFFFSRLRPCSRACLASSATEREPRAQRYAGDQALSGYSGQRKER